MCVGLGELAQQLEASVDLAEELDSVPSDHMVVSNQSQGFNTLFWNLRAPGICIHTGETLIHKKIF